MNPDDDPEARIRALEQPLSEQAAASELGGGQSGVGYVPPPAPAYTQPDYSTPVYGSPPQYGTQPYASQPYGGQPYADQQYGAQPYDQFPTKPKSSAGIPWAVFAAIAVLFIGGLVAGAVVYTTRSGSGSGISSGGGSVDISIPSMPSIEIPTAPNVPGVPVAPSAPNAASGGQVAAAGQTVTISGVDENQTVTCQDGSVTISGIRNTVNIIGHCVNVGVSGIENVVTVDAADTIGASGFDNKVTYHSGEPQIDSTGSNTVSQG